VKSNSTISLKNGKIVKNTTLIIQSKRLSSNNADNNNQDQNATSKNEDQVEGTQHLEASAGNNTESGTVNNIAQDFHGTEAQHLEANQNTNNTEAQNLEPVQNNSENTNIPAASYLLNPPQQLTTDLLDLIIPGLNSTFGPNKPVALHCFYNSSTPPTIQSINGSTTGLWDGTCQVWVNNGTEWVQAIVIFGLIHANAAVQIVNDQLAYSFDFVRIENVSSDQSIIGNIDNSQLQENLNYFLFWPSNLRNTVNMPLDQNAKFINPQIFIKDGYIELVSDLELKPYQQ
jgi:hypothetical protein